MEFQYNQTVKYLKKKERKKGIRDSVVFDRRVDKFVLPKATINSTERTVSIHHMIIYVLLRPISSRVDDNSHGRGGRNSHMTNKIINQRILKIIDENKLSIFFLFLKIKKHTAGNFCVSTELTKQFAHTHTHLYAQNN